MALARLNRRQLALGAVLAPWTRAAIALPEVQRQTRLLMGTRVQMLLPGRDSELSVAMAAAWSEMQALEAALSRYRSDNALAALAAQAGRRPLRVAPLLRDLLLQAKALSARSAGAFDVTVGAYQDWAFEAPDPERRPPSLARLREQSRVVDWRAIELDGDQVLLNRPGMRLDLGGIAKLPILEAGLQVLRRHGVRDALIDGGGDIRAIGRIHGRAWQVGLRDPLQPSQLLGSLALQDGWVASSGDYERSFVHQGRRYHHILDPRSGQPSQGLHGVSLVGGDLAELNGLGAALMVQGLDGLPKLLPPGVQALAVGAGGKRWQTPGMATQLHTA